MRRGTRVGQAYVAVTADGSGINEEIVDSVDDAGPGVEKAGREHGERYGDEFGDSLRVKFSHAGDKAGEELNRRMSDSADDAGADYGDRFEKTLKKMAKRIGNSVGARISEALKDSLGDLEETIARMVDVATVSGNGGGGSRTPTTSPGGTASNLGPPDIVTRRWEAAARMNRTFERQQTATALAGEKARIAFVAKFLAARERMHEKSNDAIAKSDAELLTTQQKLFEKLQREHLKREDDMWKQRRLAAKAHAKFLADLEKGKVDKRGVDIPGGGRNKETDLGATIGRLFGSKSHFGPLRALGVTMGGIVSLTEKARKGASEMFQTFAKGFSGGGGFSGGFKALTEGGGGVGKMFSSLAASGPAAAAAILAIVAAMSILVSVAGALLGIITALVATIASALVGALAVAGAGMLAVVAAGGLLTAAFMSMTDAQAKTLSSAFRPLKAEMVGIAQLMLRDMVPAFAVWSANLQKALQLLAPVAAVMGKAFATAGSIFTAALSGPGFQKLSQALATELPAITTRLSKALGGFLNGLAATFAAIMPLVTQFAGYLARVAARFSAWANSAAGQNAIVNFVDRAVDSLLSLWGFVQQFVGFISDVLFSPAAQKAGNGLFDSLAKSFAGFRRSISNGDLERWFNDAVDFAGDLKVMMSGLGDVIGALYNSGILQGAGTVVRNLGKSFSAAAPFVKALVDAMGFIAPAVAQILFPIGLLIRAYAAVSDAINVALQWLGRFGQFVLDIPMLGPLGTLRDALDGVSDAAIGAMNRIQSLLTFVSPLAGLIGGAVGGGGGGSGSGGSSGGFLGSGWGNDLANGGKVVGTAPVITEALPSISSLISSGTSALDATSTDRGGWKKEWKNPYVAWANSLIKEGPSVAKQIQQAIKKVNAMIRAGINEVEKAENATIARQALTALAKSATDTATGVVQAARSALNSAASELANASSPKAAAKALRDVRRAQGDMRKAIAAQQRIQDAVALLGKQKITRGWAINRLVAGAGPANATLAEMAAARNRLAVKLEKANQKLADAIALRNDYNATVTQSVQTFGSLMTAQAKTIDGVTQALTAADITDNLQSRLDKIRKFQSDLRLLIAQGLSNDAYKQLVDAGVDEGGKFAEALLGGGLSAIAETNDLVSQINASASELGLAASNRMYQAGVDAARGLVDGLNSLSSQLDSAAARLGDRIAAAVKRALGIKSPSTVLRSMMNDVGDGAVLGLNDQHVKVGNAAGRLADQIAVSPEVAAYAARQEAYPTDAGTVSGNGKDPRFRDLIVNTPTEDPEAVAMEVLNEVTGRL